MILGVAEDFSGDYILDAQLMALPESGLCLNSGTDERITIANLLEFLPFEDVTIKDYVAGTTYGNYSVSKDRKDLVLSSDKIYQSLQAGNIGHAPASNPAFWLETNLESLKLKNFIDKVENRVKSELKLTKRLINSQMIYEIGKTEVLLPGNFSAWVWEPKGSDYVTIKLDEISFQKSGTDPVNLYIINQGILIETKTVTPSNGIVEFKKLNYSLSGKKGKWIVAIDSTEVFTNNYAIDPLQFDGFVCYTATGTGVAPESAQWSYGTTGNGLGFNVSVFLESSNYIEYNLDYLAAFVRATFELMAMRLFLTNPENRSNRAKMMQQDRDLLIMETKSLENDTVARRFSIEKRAAMNSINKAFDTQLPSDSDDTLQIKISGV